MAPKYSNPPIIESIFEIVFESKDWNGAIPGLFYSKINQDLEIIQQGNSGMEVVVDGAGVRLGNNPNPVVIFQNQEGSSLVKIAPNFLSVHDLPKSGYKGWTQFAGLILKSLEILKGLVSINKVTRYSLITINKFDILEHKYGNLTGFLKTYPIVPNDEFDTNSIQMIYEQPVTGRDEVLVTKLVTIQPDGILKAPVILELGDVRVNNPDIEILGDWLEAAHKRLINNFEKSFTEEAKETFK